MEQAQDAGVTDQWTPLELLEIATRQKQIIWLILASLGASFIPFATLITGAAGVYFAYKLALAVRRSPWLYFLLGFIPLVGLFAFARLNSKATAVLKENGRAVGFLGVSTDTLRQLRAAAGAAEATSWSPEAVAGPALVGAVVLLALGVIATNKSGPAAVSGGDGVACGRGGAAPGALLCEADDAMHSIRELCTTWGLKRLPDEHGEHITNLVENVSRLDDLRKRAGTTVSYALTDKEGIEWLLKYEKDSEGNIYSSTARIRKPSGAKLDLYGARGVEGFVVLPLLFIADGKERAAAADFLGGPGTSQPFFPLRGTAVGSGQIVAAFRRTLERVRLGATASVKDPQSEFSVRVEARDELDDKGKPSLSAADSQSRAFAAALRGLNSYCMACVAWNEGYTRVLGEKPYVSVGAAADFPDRVLVTVVWPTQSAYQAVFKPGATEEIAYAPHRIAPSGIDASVTKWNATTDEHGHIVLPGYERDCQPEWDHRVEQTQVDTAQTATASAGPADTSTGDLRRRADEAHVAPSNTQGAAEPVPAEQRSDGAATVVGTASDGNRSIEDLLERWRAAQNEGDFTAYSRLYARDFVGTKRSGEREYRFDRDGWLADREKMFRAPMTVTVANVSTTPGEGRTFIEFLQTFSQGSYRDQGHKRMTVVQSGNGLLILDEEMVKSEQVTADAAPPCPSAAECNAKGMRRYKSREYDEALTYFLAAQEHDPSHGLSAYNAACTYALQGNASSSVAMLRRLERSGDPRADEIAGKVSTDPDFDRIRSAPEFVAWTGAATALARGR